MAANTNDPCQRYCFENRIRHRCDECDCHGLSDPAFGICAQTVPIIQDPVTGYFRPFSSLTTVAFARTNFAGWSNTYTEPGKVCRVQVIKCAQVELDLETPTAVKPGDLLTPVIETVDGVDRVSDWTVALTTVRAEAIYRVVKECTCDNCVKEPCPPAIGAPANVSPTAAPTRTAQRKVLAEYCIQYHSGQ